ncbi:MAG: hypothetical protein K6G42_01815 [Lachnospiraceae bacterium]|nr:hypothetical protein [Lachnospiraceae bacterium]
MKNSAEGKYRKKVAVAVITALILSLAGNIVCLAAPGRRKTEPETSGEVSEDTTETVSDTKKEAASEEVSEEASEDVAVEKSSDRKRKEAASEEVSEDASEDVAEKSSNRKKKETASEDVSEEASEDVSEKSSDRKRKEAASEEVSEEASEDVAEKSSDRKRKEAASEDTSEEASEADTDDKADKEKAEWTVLFYLCGTDLESNKGGATVNLEEVSETVPDDEVNFIIQTGGTKKWRSNDLGIEIDTTKNQRYMYDADGFTLVDEKPLGNMASKETLSDFISWGAKEYPADKYMLVIWDHGGGSEGGLIVDEIFNRAVLSVEDFGKALDTADVEFETVMFDCCEMATLEMGAQIRDNAKYMVASEEILPDFGTDYKEWLQYLYDVPECNGEELGIQICDTLQQKYVNLGDEESTAVLTFSVVDLSGMDEIIKAFDDFFTKVGDLLEDPEAFTEYAIRTSFAEAYVGKESGMVDLADLADKAKELDQLKDESIALRRAVSDAVPYCIKGTGRVYSHGLSYFDGTSFSTRELDHYTRSACSDVYLAYLDAIHPEWTAPDSVYEDMDPIEEIDFDKYIVDPEISIEDDRLKLSFLAGYQAIMKVDHILYRMDEETGEYVMLGEGTEETEDEENECYYAGFDGTWPAIGDEFCSMKTESENYSYTNFSIPVNIEKMAEDAVIPEKYDIGYYEGRTMELIGSYVYSKEDRESEGETRGKYKLYGIREKDNPDGDVSYSGKGLLSLSMISGSSVRLLYPAIEKYSNNYIYNPGETIEVTRDLSIDPKKLPAGEYGYSFVVTDVFGNDHITDMAYLSWTGKKAVFSLPEDESAPAEMEEEEYGETEEETESAITEDEQIEDDKESEADRKTRDDKESEADSKSKNDRKSATLSNDADYQEKNIPVFNDGPTDEEVVVRYYDDMPNVAYIGIKEYYDILMEGSLDKKKVTLSVENNGDGSYELENPYGSAEVDTEKDTFSSEDIMGFTNLMSMVQEGMKNGYYNGLKYARVEEVKSKGKGTVTFDLGEYDIDIREGEEDVFFPVATLEDIFSDVNDHSTEFNGEKLYLSCDSFFAWEEYDDEYEDPIVEMMEEGQRPEDLAEFSYNEMCFAIDHFYCNTGNALLDDLIEEYGFDTALQEYGEIGETTSEYLRSTDFAEYYTGFDLLCPMLYDGQTFACIIAGEEVPEIEEKKAELEEELEPYFEELWDEADKNSVSLDEGMVRAIQREEAFDDEEYIKQGDTAVFVLDSFYDYAADVWEEYYDEDGDKNSLMNHGSDNVLNLIEALEDASADDEIDNFVIDVSLNSGGSIDNMAMVYGLISGKREVTVKMMNMLTGQEVEQTYELDRNLDKVFDKLDEKGVYDLNFGVITSEQTMYSANCFAGLMKEDGCPVMGQKSGGGVSLTQALSTGEGYSYYVSSKKGCFVNQDGTVATDGIDVDVDLIPKDKNGENKTVTVKDKYIGDHTEYTGTDYSALYDIDRISEEMDDQFGEYNANDGNDDRSAGSKTDESKNGR